MRIHAFRVMPLGQALPQNTLSMDDVIDTILSRPLEDRMLGIDSTLRIEAGQRNSSGSWFLDFTEIRQRGPGRCSPNSPISDFDLADNEGFGEETAAYFDGSSGFIIIQYNHRGAKARSIQTYFQGVVLQIARERHLAAQAQGFNFAVVLRPGALARFNDHRHIRAIELSVSVPMVRESDRGVQSLSQVLETGAAVGATTLELKMTVGRERHGRLNIDAIRNIVTELLPLGGDSVNSLSIKTGDGDGPAEIIDLLNERLEQQVVVPTGRNSRRLDRNARWHALEETFNAWTTDGLLT